MQRIVEPEFLDELPPEDPRAIRSRRDLRRVNVLMRSHSVMADALRGGANGWAPKHLLDLGAGDGDFLLRVARRLPTLNRNRGAPVVSRRFGDRRSGSWQGVSASLLDRLSLAAPATLKEFEKLGWRAEKLIADVFVWARQPSAKPVEAVVANLFLHHFSDAQVAELFRAIGKVARLFVAVEPRRAAWPLGCSRLLWAVGCNAITQHDAAASVRAGFARRELSALWPGDDGWILTEKPAGLFSHVFVARRRR